MPAGKYDGRAIVELLEDGRCVRLKSPFGYVDPRGRRWKVPADAIVDGTSISRPLWTLILGMTGKIGIEVPNRSLISDDQRNLFRAKGLSFDYHSFALPRNLGPCIGNRLFLPST